MGHGFYQFSPELFYRVFQAENGFEIKDIFLESNPFPGTELSDRNIMYSVSDPAVLRERVGLVSKSPVVIFVHAVKRKTTEIFSQYPIQSDYASMYKNHRVNGERPVIKRTSVVKNILLKLYSLLPLRLRNFIYGKRQLRRYNLKNSRFYQKWPKS